MLVCFLFLVCIVGITAGFVVAFHGLIPPAFAGLALAYSGQFSGLLQYTVRLAVETESRFMSVQRMQSYLKVKPYLNYNYHLRFS